MPILKTKNIGPNIIPGFSTNVILGFWGTMLSAYTARRKKRWSYYYTRVLHQCYIRILGNYAICIYCQEKKRWSYYYTRVLHQCYIRILGNYAICIYCQEKKRWSYYYTRVLHQCYIRILGNYAICIYCKKKKGNNTDSPWIKGMNLAAKHVLYSFFKAKIMSNPKKKDKGNTE